MLQAGPTGPGAELARLSAHADERARDGRAGICDVAVRRDADNALLAELRAVSRVLPARPQDERHIAAARGGYQLAAT
jgi:hypothetical protein